MFHADWFAHCDKCDSDKWMDGKTLRAAKITARKAGWYISSATTLCPKCHHPTPLPHPESTQDAIE